jgi:ComF family protein
MFGPLLAAFRQLMLPTHCAACDGPAPADRRFPFCDPCGRALAALVAAPYCPRCGRHAGPHTADERGCMFCRLYPIQHDATVRIGQYADPLRGLILRYKYQGRAQIAAVLGRLLGERLAMAPWADTVDLIVPVPLHWTRQAMRGYNQAELLAGAVADAGGKARVRRRLLRVRPTPHQNRLPAGERRRNVRGAFQVGRRASDLQGKAVLLVDDVMTSGTTVAECTEVLKSGGAAAVYVAVVATADYDEPGPW